MKLSKYVILLIFMLSVCACATAARKVAEPKPSYTLKPARDGLFADFEAAFVKT